MDMLIDSLNAIRTEMDFYNQTAEKYELKFDEAGMSDVTREYVDFFREVGREDKSILQGLVLLWATEHVRCPPFPSFALCKAPKCTILVSRRNQILVC